MPMRTEASNLAATTTSPAWRPWALLRGLTLAAAILCVLAGLAALGAPPLAAAWHARSAADLSAGPYDPARLARAADELDAALRWRPGDPVLLRAQAQIATMRNQPRQAIALLEAAVAADPAGRLAQIRLAEAYELVGDEGRAIALWRGLGMTQGYTINRGVDALLTKEDMAALRWFRRAAALGDASPAIDEVRGLIDNLLAQRLGGDARRLELLKIARRLAPDQRLIWYELGQSYLAAGDWRAAYATHRQGLRAAEGAVGQSNFYFHMGRIWQYGADEPNLDAAWADYEQAIQLGDFQRDRWQIAEAYHSRAVIRANQRRWDEALAEEQLALAVNPDHYFVNLGMGIILTALDRPAEGLPYAQRAVELFPERAVGYRRIGEIAVALGDTALARSSFERALALDPADTAARRGLERLSAQP